MELDHSVLSDFGQATEYEWLESNGLGGWASSTACGANTRRYHGLLVAATTPPTGRVVMLSRLDETIGIGPLRCELGCNQYPGVIHPHGHTRLTKFSYDMFPTFHYQLGEIALKKTIAAINGENTVVVLYEVLNALEPFRFELQPFVVARDYHAMAYENGFISQKATFKEGGELVMHPYPTSPELRIFVPKAKFDHSPQWHKNVEYRRERERGATCNEDMFSYGHFRLTLKKGDRLGVVISTRAAIGRDAFQLFEMERERRLKIVADLPVKDEFAQTLALASEKFLVQRGAQSKTVIAGYPWFTDWGRDTMIALPGLCLVTRRFEDAKKIFRAFAEHSSQGMVPNCFPEGTGQPSYNTVDATMWFFNAIYQYHRYTGDDAFIKTELLDLMLDFIDWHRRGTRFNIHADRDEMLWGGGPETQLTWMDATSNGDPVTPRYGKAVEINALWCNALLITAEFCERFGKKQRAAELLAAGEVARNSFRRLFWNNNTNCLFDYITTVEENGDIRPNQIIALALPYSVLPEYRAKMVLRVVADKLLTPCGLRTLDPDNSAYRGYYYGDGATRDSAYHQGTVWPWLMGPYITALSRYGSAQEKRTIPRLFDGLKQHVMKAGIGSISEILDGNDPHNPAGCPFQAWSVAEVLRCYMEDVLGIVPEGDPKKVKVK